MRHDTHAMPRGAQSRSDVPGLGTCTNYVNTLVTLVADSHPGLDKRTVALVSCLVLFAVGLVFVTPGGQQLLQMVGLIL